MVKPVAASIAVVLCGTGAMGAVPFALDLRDRTAWAVEIAILLGTLGGFVAVARRLLARPYLRRQHVVAAAVAPFAFALALAAVLYGLELAGADCPRSGMDYISECNDLAGVSMMVFFLGIYAAALLTVIAAGVLLAAGVKRTREARRRAGSARAAGGSR